MTILKHNDFEVPNFGELSTPPIAVPAYADAIQAMSPRAYWRLDEQAGTTLADNTANHPLTLAGGYALDQPGALQMADSRSVQFTGGSASATGPVLPTTAGAPFTLAFWVRRPPGSIDSGTFVGQYTANTTGHARLILRSTTAQLRLLVSGGEDLSTNASIGEAWHFAVLTRSSAGEVRWYIDGQLDAQDTGATSALAAVPFQLGEVVSNPAGVYLDAVAVFDHEWSADEVRWLYGLGTASLALPPTP